MNVYSSVLLLYFRVVTRIDGVPLFLCCRDVSTTPMALTVSGVLMDIMVMPLLEPQMTANLAHVLWPYLQISKPFGMGNKDKLETSKLLYALVRTQWI